MVVGVDIDGVLTHLDEYQLKNTRKYFKNHFNKDVVNPQGSSLREIYGCSAGAALGYWIPRYIPYIYTSKVRNGANQFFDYLRNNNMKIVIITSRFSPLIEILTKKWLSKNNLQYDDIIFCPKNKINAVKKYNVNVIVEDLPKNINMLKNYVPVLVMETTYNKNMPEENRLIKINGFDEAINYLENNKELLVSRAI